jgi:hypothetical protein
LISGDLKRIPTSEKTTELKIMSKIKIGNLQAAGVEMFQGSESFLTELQSTEANQIFGGKCRNKSRKGGKSGSVKCGKSVSKSGSSKSGCGGPSPTPLPLPLPIPTPIAIS